MSMNRESKEGPVGASLPGAAPPNTCPTCGAPARYLKIPHPEGEGTTIPLPPGAFGGKWYHDCGEWSRIVGVGAALEAGPSLAEIDPERLAQRFHEVYEILAPQFGYATRPETSMPWKYVPEPNKLLIVAVAGEILQELRGEAGPSSAQHANEQLLQDALETIKANCSCGAAARISFPQTHGPPPLHGENCRCECYKRGFEDA